jgi:hypothetical protein
LCHKLDPGVREALARDFYRLCPEPFIVSVLAHERDYYPPQTHACVLHSHDLSGLVNTLAQQLAASSNRQTETHPGTTSGVVSLETTQVREHGM